MAFITLTNTVASQALRGQSVKVTLGSSENSYLQDVQVGALCGITATGDNALVQSVDYFGNSFEITPLQPNFDCHGSIPGYLNATDTVVVTI